MVPSATDPLSSEDTSITTLRKILINPEETLGRRYRALFSLKHLARQGSLPAIHAIAAGFSDDSELLKHEMAYCLGQSKNLAAVPILTEVLEDKEQEPMTRHEAAEALAAIGEEESLELLRRVRDDPEELVAVAETCEIAVAKIEWEHSEARKLEKVKESDFGSIDPSPPADASETLEQLEKELLDTSLPLFTRYRAMFGLRDLASPLDLPTAIPAVHALGKAFGDSSALLKHEIAFVMGQIAHPESLPYLKTALADISEADMVRHEAAEALGSLGDVEGVDELLKSYLKDLRRVVSESIVVALDMAEYERSGEAEYALMP